MTESECNHVMDGWIGKQEHLSIKVSYDSIWKKPEFKG